MPLSVLCKSSMPLSVLCKSSMPYLNCVQGKQPHLIQKLCLAHVYVGEQHYWECTDFPKPYNFITFALLHGLSK